MSECIKLVDRGLPTAPIYWALQKRPDLWNERTERTVPTDSPHHGLDDIWARFVRDEHIATGGPSVWMPPAEALGVKALCLDVMRRVDGVELGGVLITRIPAGKVCKPHTDSGWHAERYEKFGVQLTSAPGQRFCFEDGHLETMPGDLFWFRNDRKHWVTNDTPFERVTMIVCVRRE